MKKVARLVLAGAMGCLAAQQAPGQDWVRELDPQQLSEGDRFGSAMAVDSNSALVGSPRHDQNSLVQDSGQAHVFVEVGGTCVEQATLQPVDPVTLGKFGHAVDLSGDTALVGAPDAQNLAVPSGAAYFFERAGSTWSPGQRVSAPFPTAGDRFGWSLAVDGSWAAVGAYGDDSVGFNAGAVHLFRRVGAGSWVYDSSLYGPDGEANDFFGRSVDLLGGRLAVGAPGDDDAGLNTGAVYLFERERMGWVLHQKVSVAGTEAHARFGEAVRLGVDSCAVGATFDDMFSSHPGYVDFLMLREGEFVVVERLQPSGASERDDFGSSIALLGDELLVGAPRSNVALSGGGASWLFSRVGDGWVEWSALSAPGVGQGDACGSAVALGPGRAWVAGRQDSDRVALGGSVQVWSTENLPEHRTLCSGWGCPCGNDDLEAGCQNTTGRGARLSPAGSLSRSQDDLVLRIESAPPGQPVLLLWGTQSSPAMVGDGLRCVSTGGSLGAPKSIQPDGTQLFGPGLIAAGGFVPPEGAVYFQAWYRDPHGSLCSGFSNFTDGLALEFGP